MDGKLTLRDDPVGDILYVDTGSPYAVGGVGIMGQDLDALEGIL